MIKEFSTHATPTNGKAKIAFSVCFFASFILLFSSSAFTLYKWVPQLIGMGLLVAAILLYTKFLSSRFSYEIAFDIEGTPLFIVNQMIGKRATTLCRVSLCEIVKIERESAEERKKHKTPGGVKKYNYSPTFLPESTCRIYTSGKHERAEIIIEATDEFCRLLSEYANEAREMASAALDDEEY